MRIFLFLLISGVSVVATAFAEGEVPDAALASPDRAPAASSVAASAAATGDAVVSRTALTEAKGLQEFTLDIAGGTDFSSLARIKRSLRTKLPVSATFFERTLTRGQVVLAIRAPMSEEELLRVLSEISEEPGGFRVVESNGRAINARVTRDLRKEQSPR